VGLDGRRVPQAGRLTVSSAQTRAVATAVVACLAVLGATALPWLRTGDARRSAFALARGADALGFIDSPGRRALLVTWYLLPFLAAAAWTAGALRRPAVVATLAALIGVMSIVAGSLVIAWVRFEAGPLAAVAAGAAAVGSAGWLARTIASARRDTPIERGWQ
jgi:hypothetical protein